jgi:hypothetical protein
MKIIDINKDKSKLEELGKRLEEVSKGHFRKDLINKYSDGIVTPVTNLLPS